MKKQVLIIGSITALISVAVCMYFFIFLLVAIHWSIIENAHNYKTGSVLSFDGKYLLCTERIDDESGVYASFFIISKDNDETVYSCLEKYRTSDLKGIFWVGNSYNVIVESGDVGPIVYYYDHDNWKQ